MRSVKIIQENLIHINNFVNAARNFSVNFEREFILGMPGLGSIHIGWGRCR